MVLYIKYTYQSENKTHFLFQDSKFGQHDLIGFFAEQACFLGNLDSGDEIPDKNER